MGWKQKILEVFKPDFSESAKTDYVSGLENPVIKHIESEMEGRYMLKLESLDSVAYHMAIGALDQPEID